MHVLRSSLLAVALLLWATPLHATEIIVDSEAGCLAIGGELSYGTSCVVNGRLIVPAGTRIVVDRRVSLTVGGLVIVDGVLETHGGFAPNGGLTNRGTLITSGLTVNGWTVLNEATWLNHGWLHPHGAVINRGDFVNDGLFETCMGQFENHGFTHNLARGSIANWGGWMTNFGIWVNDGTIYNPEGDTYHVINRGSIENNGTFENWGLADGTCGSVWHGDGAVIGYPLEGSWCPPTTATDLLIAVVLDLDPAHQNVLTKDETIALWSLLARASKRLDAGADADAASAIQLFLDEVEVLASTGLPSHISHALVAWAAQIFELMEL